MVAVVFDLTKKSVFRYHSGSHSFFPVYIYIYLYLNVHSYCPYK